MFPNVHKEITYFARCFQISKKKEFGPNEKSQQVYLIQKEEEEAISAIRDAFIHGSESLGIVPILQRSSL